jgi:pilus assembly protein CpaC
MRERNWRFQGRVLAIVLTATLAALPAAAQQFSQQPVDTQSPLPVQPVVQKIEAANSKVEMMVNGSRILMMDGPIPKAQVANPDLLDFTVLSESQVQIHAKKAGITTVNLWDEKQEIHTVDVIVTGDIRELDNLLRMQFPTASIKLYPTSSSTLILFGYVDRADYVNRIVQIAQDYFPKVLNNMIVGGSQQVLLHVKVLEVSRTNLKILGFDWMNFSAGGDFIGSSASGIITKANPTASVFRTAGAMTTAGRETLQFGVVSNPEGFVGFLEALKQEDLAKVLAEPNLVTVSGRPASYLVGGQMPYPQPTGFGNIAINFRDFGTQIDFVPIVLGNGGVRLEVRPRVSEIDPTLSITVNGTSVPGFRMREVDTGVELKFGQTLAIAGLLQQRVQMQKRGIPYLMDVPYLGAAFSRKENKINEVELLILVRPELVEAMDPEQVPPCGPGMTSMSPADCELFWKGYMEVPVKLPGGGPGPMMGPAPEAIPAGEPSPADDAPPADRPRPSDADVPSARRAAPGQGVGTAVVISDGPQSPRVAAASARRALPAPGAASPYNPSTSQAPKTPGRSNAQTAPPGFIGPRGYDVRN